MRDRTLTTQGKSSWVIGFEGIECLCENVVEMGTLTQLTPWTDEKIENAGI